jgi:ABC-type transporter Mla subunit MlaD
MMEDTASQVTNAAGQAAQQAKQAVAPITEQAQETAGQVAEQAKQQALTQLGTQKEHAAGSLDAVAQALRQSGDQLREKQQEPLAHLAGTAAERVEQFSSYLRHTDVSDMLRDVEQFARRQPAAFLGGAFTLGVLAARFLKSSSRPAADQGMATAGRMPSYRGYGASPYATSGTSRYPAASSPLAPASATGGDPGSVDTAMPDPGLRGAPAGSGTTASGWGYTPRRDTRPEQEGR